MKIRKTENDIFDYSYCKLSELEFKFILAKKFFHELKIYLF